MEQPKNCITCAEKIFKNNLGKWMMRIENGNWNDLDDACDYDDIEINYCYKCGKKYGGES